MRKNLLNIVCGAPNVAAGQRVVVATIGTTIYKGDESFQIKKAKIRGVVSEGMICAEDEIGLGTSHDGIMVLPADAPVGMPAETLISRWNPKPCLLSDLHQTALTVLLIMVWHGIWLPI